MKKTDIPAQKPGPRAFVKSDKHMLNGVRLQPWTPARIVAAQSMGMLYPLIGKEGYDALKRTSMYPGALKDTIIALWLCSISPEAVEDADAVPSDSYKAARKWAIEQGIHQIDSDAFWSAYATFFAIMDEVTAAATKRVAKTGDEDDDPPND